MQYTRYPVEAGGVTSLDGMTGAITLVAGPGITIVDGAQTITISSTSAGDVTIGAFGSTPNANGLSINGSQVLNMQPADATHPGGISIADWNTFNNKQAAGSYITALTGDVTASGPGSVAATLATVNSNVGSFTNANITVNAKGLITAAANGSGGGANTALSNLAAVAINTSLLPGTGGTISLGGTSKDWLNIYMAGQIKDTAGNNLIDPTSFRAMNGSANVTLNWGTGFLANNSGTSVLTWNGAGSSTSINLPNLTASTALVLDGSKNMASLAYNTVATASNLAQFDTNKNLNPNNVNEGYTLTTSLPYTLTVASTKIQVINMVASSTVTMPVVSTLVLGQSFLIINMVGSGGQTINSSGANAITVLASGTSVLLTCVLTTGTTAASWAISQASLPNAVVGVTTFGTVPNNNGASIIASGITGVLQLQPADATHGGGVSTTTQTFAGAKTFSTPIALGSGGTGASTKATAFDALSPMTTGGDIIYGGASGTGTRLANGSAGQFLKSNGTTLAPSWAAPTITLTAPTIQKFTSGSGTYTTAASVLYIRVEMVGAGGGGSGGGSSGAGAGGTGGNSTFGTTLLVANGGVGGATNTVGGAGGTASLGTGPVGTALQGGSGNGSMQTVSPIGGSVGGAGSGTPFGGAGAGGADATAGSPGITNTGSGGGGGGGQSSALTVNAGAGGGAGGYVNALIYTPSATYAYAVGAAGTAGGAGTTGAAGAAGGSGYILVTEYYQ